jgi:hypothetical protein
MEIFCIWSSMRKANRKNKETHKSKEGRGRTGPLREGHLNNDQNSVHNFNRSFTVIFSNVDTFTTDKLSELKLRLSLFTKKNKCNCCIRS